MNAYHSLIAVVTVHTLGRAYLALENADTPSFEGSDASGIARKTSSPQPRKLTCGLDDRYKGVSITAYRGGT